VRCYVQRTLRLGAATLVQPVPARASHVLDFEFGGPVEVRRLGTEVTRTAAPASLIGMLTHYRNQLLSRGTVETFVIVFEPAAIYHLFGLPAFDQVDCDHEVHSVIGAAASVLQERLGNAGTFEERVAIADDFITDRSCRAPAYDPIERAAKEIVRHHGACRIDSLAHQTGLSMRNFQRMFQQRVGVPAKLFSRIVRFEASLKCKAVHPHLSWTVIAHQYGYHDQMHMIHDFRHLAGETPAGILEQATPVLAPQIDLTAKEGPARLLL
jgi:AraC-like DNA-binding protein